MNSFQKIWWEQTQSDHSVLVRLRNLGVPDCHQLHYLQMVTEKLGKACFWRTGAPPPKTHVVFVRFLQSLDDRKKDVGRIAQLLGFQHVHSFEAWIRTDVPLAYALERLAPALANDGPNPEYPWPMGAPTDAPTNYTSTVWKELTGQGGWQGRQLLKVIDAAVREFPNYC